MKKILILIFLIICNLSTVRSQEIEGVNAAAIETGYIDVEGGKIYYESAGKEDPYQMYVKNTKAKERCYQLLKANPQNADFRKSTFVQPAERPAVKYLSEIKVPALILVGEFDIPDVHAHSGVIESGITGAKREVILNAGHLIPMEQPEAFNKVVLEFLKSKRSDLGSVVS